MVYKPIHVVCHCRSTDQRSRLGSERSRRWACGRVVVSTGRETWHRVSGRRPSVSYWRAFVRRVNSDRATPLNKASVAAAFRKWHYSTAGTKLGSCRFPCVVSRVVTAAYRVTHTRRVLGTLALQRKQQFTCAVDEGTNHWLRDDIVHHLRCRQRGVTARIAYERKGEKCWETGVRRKGMRVFGEAGTTEKNNTNCWWRGVNGGCRKRLGGSNKLSYAKHPCNV